MEKVQRWECYIARDVDGRPWVNDREDDAGHYVSALDHADYAAAKEREIATLQSERDALAARVAELENEVREANGRADAHEKLAESCFNDAVRFRWAAESKQFQYWLSTNSADEARAAIDAAITAAGTGGGE